MSLPTLLTVPFIIFPTHQDQGAFAKLVDAVKTNFNARHEEFRKQWGGGIMGPKSQAATLKKEKARAREEAKRLA